MYLLNIQTQRKNSISDPIFFCQWPNYLLSVTSWYHGFKRCYRSKNSVLHIICRKIIFVLIDILKWSYVTKSMTFLNESFTIGLNFLYTIHTIYRKIWKKGSGWLNLSADYWNDEISARLIFPQRQLSNWNSAAKLIGSRGWTSMCHTHTHTTYLSFFLHSQKFWKIKFTPKFTQ